MFSKNHNLMPALLTATLLALAGAATAQEHGVLEHLHEEAMTDPAPFVPVESFSATDHYSTFVVDTCVESHGAANPALGLTPEVLAAVNDDSNWIIAEDGETVLVEGYTAAAAPSSLHFADFQGFVDIQADPCCVCGTDGTNPMGCKAYGKVCCCKAEISLKLDEMTCYCQGGKDCTNMVG